LKAIARRIDHHRLALVADWKETLHVVDETLALAGRADPRGARH
jgi:hypothetical protein